MIHRSWLAWQFVLLAFLSASFLAAQPGEEKKGFGKKDFFFGGPPGGQTRKVVKDFDKNGDGWLNAEERQAARESVKKGGGGFKGFKGGFGGKGGEEGKPGPKVAPADVTNYPKASLYEPTVLRTVFLEFENKDWEAELEDFHGTDVEVPATLTVDGKTYKNVGVHFRGMSSYMGVRAGSKRSFGLSLDLADKKQRLYGTKTLNLLNSHDDPSLLSTVLYSHVARQHIPAPKANFVKVVINGESWGVYVNAQQFNKEFIGESFKTTKGARWKVRGNPGASAGLEYFGEDLDQYKRRFDLRSPEDPKAWQALIKLCKMLNETPADKLEAALAPMVDIDNLLWFLALDVALVNNDGYWTRASDYSLYLDPKGKFHFVPHDMNEAFQQAGGFGGPKGGPGGGPKGGPGGFGPGGGGPGGGGFIFRLPKPGEFLPEFAQDQLKLSDEQKKEVAAIQKEIDTKLDKLLTADQRKQLKEMRERGPGGFGPPGGFGMMGGGVDLDPLVGLNNTRMPLRSKVLAVPALRERYLAHVKTIARDDLDWKKLGPVVAQYRGLIEKEVEIDTRKLSSLTAFRASVNDAPGKTTGGRGMSLRNFADQRRTYLLNYQPKVASDSKREEKR